MKRVAFLAMCLLALRTASASTWYVDGSVSASGDGKSWKTAFRRIQRGIDAASDADSVIVAQGTYVENIRFEGKNITLRGTDPLDPSVVASTIIDGNQAGSVVTFSASEDETCTLAGFTIRNGASSMGAGIRGGGWGERTRATIRNNVITGNSAGDGGGIVWCDGLIQNNEITENSAPEGGVGGGIGWCDGIIQNNLVAKNRASRGGGFYGCQGTIQNNTIVANRAGSGAAMAECLQTTRNCIIWYNVSAANWPVQFYDCRRPTHSCYHPRPTAENGNIGDDPGFIDLDGGDYRLGENSPCIDAGADDYWFAWPQRDLAGNCRLARGRVDMGCYEYGSSADFDGDLLSDADEPAAGTDPSLADTDGDGLRDGLERLRGSDPLQPTPARVVRVPFDVSSTQKALCLAMNGEKIIVAAGTRRGNLQFCGPDVILRSSDPFDSAAVASTILEGLGAGPVVCFTGAESGACVLSGFTITGGSADAGGGVCGGSQFGLHTHATIENNVIAANTVEHRGGGLAYCDGAIRNNVIAHNEAVFFGGGLSACAGTLQNNVIADNRAISGGGLSACHGIIRNNTITSNSARDVGAGLNYCLGTIHNCIMWGNTAPNDAQLCDSARPTFCCIQDWTEGYKGNTRDDPLFVDAFAEDYRLSANSPCIDAGRNAEWMRDAVDLDGNPRIWNGKVDVGAYEYGSWPFRIINAFCGTGGTKLTWSSRTGDSYTVCSCGDLSSDTWTERGTVASEGATTSWTDTVPVDGMRFYRVGLK